MAWRWIEKLTARRKSRSGKPIAKRRLAFEQVARRQLAVEPLEQRRLLVAGSINLFGTIVVMDLVGSTGDVPVRGIHVHAWLGDNATYDANPTPGAASKVNGTGPGGIYADAYTNNQGRYSVVLNDPNGISLRETVHIVAITQSNISSISQYEVIQPGTSPPATLVYVVRHPRDHYSCQPRHAKNLPDPTRCVNN